MSAVGDLVLPPILWWSTTLAEKRQHDLEFAPGVLAELPGSDLYWECDPGSGRVLSTLPSDARRLVVAPPAPFELPTELLNLDDIDDVCTAAGLTGNSADRWRDDHGVVVDAYEVSLPTGHEFSEARVDTRGGTRVAVVSRGAPGLLLWQAIEAARRTS